MNWFCGAQKVLMRMPEHSLHVPTVKGPHISVAVGAVGVRGSL